MGLAQAMSENLVTSVGDRTQLVAPNERLQRLAQKSVQTLRTLLTDPQVPAQQRALIALQLLEALGLEKDPPKVATESVQSPAPDAENTSPYPVTVLLEGGHRYELALELTCPLFNQLLESMLLQAQGQQAAGSELLQIPLREGKAALYVPSHQLIGLEIDPSLAIELLAPDSEQSPVDPPGAIKLPERSQSSSTSHQGFAPISAKTNDQSAFPSSQLLVAKCLHLENFLTPEENAQALQIAISKASEFVGSNTSTRADNYRESSVLYATLFPEFYMLLKDKILQALPSVLEQVQYPAFPIGLFEMQLTAHNDGCYYKIHNDSGSPDTATREFTYVYYFHQEPIGFSGGELRLYDTYLLSDNGFKATDTFQTITPRNNSIVFFDSRLKHEVMPVSCPSKAFTDSRFTLNGWLRRVD